LSNSKEQPTKESNNNNNILSIIQTNHNEYSDNLVDGDKTIKAKDFKKMSFDSTETITNFDKNDSMSQIFDEKSENFSGPTDDSTIKPVIDATGTDNNNISSGIPIIDLKQLIQKNTFQKPKVNFDS